MVQKGNPFTEVLDEIEKMLKLIVKEGKQDKENLDWCNTEREENDASHAEKVNQIDTLNGEIETLEETIDDPEIGLKAQIKEAEESLESCVTSQKTETKERTEANLLYQADMKNLVDRLERELQEIDEEIRTSWCLEENVRTSTEF